MVILQCAHVAIVRDRRIFTVDVGLLPRRTRVACTRVHRTSPDLVGPLAEVSLVTVATAKSRDRFAFNGELQLVGCQSAMTVIQQPYHATTDIHNKQHYAANFQK